MDKVAVGAVRLQPGYLKTVLGEAKRHMQVIVSCRGASVMRHALSSNVTARFVLALPLQVLRLWLSSGSPGHRGFARAPLYLACCMNSIREVLIHECYAFPAWVVHSLVRLTPALAPALAIRTARAVVVDMQCAALVC